VKPECGGRLEDAGLSPSIGSVADAYNNSTAESPGGEAIFEYAEKGKQSVGNSANLPPYR
jgi:hypothetical protein